MTTTQGTGRATPLVRPAARLLLAAFLVTACLPRESLDGADVIWTSENGKERVVQMGPCVKTQAYDDYSYVWRTTYTECAVPSVAP